MTLLAALTMAAAAACPGASSPNGPGELHRQWILEGWERREGRIARTAAEYASFWEGPFNRMLSARHAVTDGPDVLIGDSLASTTLEFVARLEQLDGKVSSIRARSSLVWRCENETWRIVREQNAVREAQQSEVETALRSKGGSYGR
jgi:hypothetical protein